ncbi:flagellar basal-body MS-ring/collar protein FliF [Siminovitchia sp. FSL H7-0308]|uniref:Flagellar M-ring protein n=1 Tax=Siminovitchia thermophila TaxID=1245522 RepID=A0ABS2RA30_9BACI|nr:flagellar basal-body MS-ring/collar protein FliF [Siminovitchia thermophila]MBM7716482.1 flagellar M-ring protein FliF [Siminovitchia thermophila]ONK23242.1 flagellar M-ring protein FliF [Bacillus sp. VT-16-64]
MREKLEKQLQYIKNFWVERSKKQKILFISLLVIGLLLVVGLTYIFNRPSMVPLYTNLKAAETGSIKENLDSKGIKSEITDDGTTIKVPEGQAESLMVELAAEGIPKSGNIDYSFFSDNASFGMTDNEFNVIKLDAMQNELSEMIASVEGVDEAKVMINIPEKSVFVKEGDEKATASIVLQTQPGHEFTEKQIRSLYHLVSKSVPNLPTENIVIRNQYLEYYDLEESGLADNRLDQQMKIKDKIEKNIQRQVQQMLGTLTGFDKVVTLVTADIDFSQENREENLVTPVDEENMRGIAISAQRINEAYTGEEGVPGGVPQASDPADAGANQYVEGAGNNGEYEKSEETINYEVNKVRKEIVESPYKIRDLGIQVMVEPPDPEDENSFPEERVDDIRDILSTVVRTSIDKDPDVEVTDEEIENKVVVSVQPFNGKTAMDEEAKGSLLPWWAYIIFGLLVAIIATLIFLWIRSSKSREEAEEVEVVEQPEDTNADTDMKAELEPFEHRKQLEVFAQEKPEQFAELLRTWLADDEEA